MELKISTAKKLYPEAPEWFKSLLVYEFGADAIKVNNYEDIKTFEDACMTLNINPESVLNASDTTDEIAYKKLKIIIKAINDGWTPDWSDNMECKYYPLFETLPSGFDFSNSLTTFTYTRTEINSYLCFESSEKCIYTVQQFIDIYKDFFTITK
jgi:hypothetical protein